ncbi:MAG: tyrosine-type recombinase/integrase [Verrucomicrobiales bacterium]|nr:tyrosine-type recombinase/integrase [Verrucomicrobiales bacterium]
MIPASELERTVQNSINRTATGQTLRRRSGRLPKSHVDYWQARLKKRSYLSRDGSTDVEIPTWQVRLFQAGREGWFNLGTANKAAAAVKARDIHQFLAVNGWEATLANFKGDSDATPARNKLTIGEYLQAVQATAALRTRTFLNYQNCLRTTVAGAFGVKDGPEKFDYRAGGNKKWVERVDSIRLERITADRIIAWQRKFVGRAGRSPIAIGSAKRTANSYVRCARSLFSREILKQLKNITLPSPLPFESVDLFDAGSMKYISKVNVETLVVAAKAELKQTEPEVYKAFLLGLFAGMRKGEIDLVEWRMVDWENHVIRVEETEWLRLKTEDSRGEIAVDPEVIAELRQMMPQTEGRFILSSERPPRNDSRRPYYRCDPIFDRLNAWLRSKGVSANKPLHELRKEIGALVATQHGIHAASRFLRHSDITTTARHYADHKARISVGLGKLLDTKIQSVGISGASQ